MTTDTLSESITAQRDTWRDTRAFGDALQAFTDKHIHTTNCNELVSFLSAQEGHPDEDALIDLGERRDYVEAAEDHAIRLTDSEAAETLEYFGLDRNGYETSETDAGILAHEITSLNISASDYCDHFHLEPYTLEPLNHWCVSPDMALWLDREGELVREVNGLHIWARCHDSSVSSHAHGVAGSAVMRDILESLRGHAYSVADLVSAEEKA